MTSHVGGLKPGVCSVRLAWSPEQACVESRLSWALRGLSVSFCSICSMEVQDLKALGFVVVIPKR